MRTVCKTVCALLLLAVIRPAKAVTVSIDCTDRTSLAGIVDESTTDLILTGRAQPSLLSLITELAPSLQSLDMSALQLTPAAVPPYAFAASSIRSITLPNDLTDIGEAAFAGSAITSMSLPTGVDSIAPHSFSQCTSLGRVDMPGVRSIGRKAFAGCKALQAIDYPATLAVIGEEAFTTTALVRAEMKHCEALDSIGDFAFASCSALEHISLPTHIINIGKGAMMNCQRLTAVDGNRCLSEIPDLMLASDTALESADIVASSPVESLGNYSFSGTESIAHMTLPGTLSYLGDYAMERMTGLQTINTENLDEVPGTGDNVWNLTPQNDITLKTNPQTAQKFKDAPQWSEFDITDGLTTGIDSPESQSGITLFFEGNTMRITSSRPVTGVTVHDLQGRLRSDVDGINSCDAVVGTSGWNADGMYIVSIHTDGATEIRQIIRQTNR